MPAEPAGAWPPPRLARLALACLDLTSLGEDDDRGRIAGLCASAASGVGSPAALCVYPEWLVFARERLDAMGLHGVVVATVANFPDGSTDVARAVRECRRASAAGVEEIDLVFPWRSLREGDAAAGEHLVAACREASAGRTLKVILESGELGEPGLIRRASRIALSAGADFIKTSTGKAGVHATPEAAEVMLAAIAEHGRGGFKASGGLRKVADVQPYAERVERLLGAEALAPARFRIGASSLLDDIRQVLANDGAPHGRDG